MRNIPRLIQFEQVVRNKYSLEKWYFDQGAKKGDHKNDFGKQPRIKKRLRNKLYTVIIRLLRNIFQLIPFEQVVRNKYSLEKWYFDREGREIGSQDSRIWQRVKFGSRACSILIIVRYFFVVGEIWTVE